MPAAAPDATEELIYDLTVLPLKDCGREYLAEEAHLLFKEELVSQSEYRDYLKNLPEVMDNYAELDQARRIFVDRLRGRSVPVEFGSLKEKVAVLKRLFDDVDRDGRGELTQADLRKCYFSVTGEDATDTQISKLLESADCDKDGVIKWDEFMLVFANEEYTVRGDLMQDLKNAFATVDTNDDRAIDIDELRQAMKTLGDREDEPTDEEVYQLFSEADLDESGLITFDEFILSVYGWYTGRLIDFLFTHDDPEPAAPDEDEFEELEGEGDGEGEGDEGEGEAAPGDAENGE